MHELVDDGIAKLHTAQAANRFQRPLTRNGGAEHAIPRHSAIGVDQTRHFGGEADSLEADRPGIAAAIVTFVVLGNDAKHSARKPALADQQFERTGHMRLDLAELDIAQRFFLGENVGRDVNLPDVLHQAGAAEFADRVAPEPEKTPENHQQDRDIDRMIVGVLIGRLEPGQPEHGVRIALDTCGELVDQIADARQIDGCARMDGFPNRRKCSLDVFNDRCRIEQLFFEAGFAERTYLSPRLIVGHPGTQATCHRQELVVVQRTKRQAAAVALANHRHILVADRTTAVDINQPAQRLQLTDLRFIVDQEALQQKGRAQPRAVQLGHENAQPEEFNLDRLVREVALGFVKDVHRTGFRFITDILLVRFSTKTRN